MEFLETFLLHYLKLEFNIWSNSTVQVLIIYRLNVYDIIYIKY